MQEKLTMERAKELLSQTTAQEHLLTHALAVSACMDAVAEYFGQDRQYWKAVGYLHDYDYERYPQEHLQHTQEPLQQAGVDEESIRAIMAHGYGLCSNTEPLTPMEKNLFAVDELSGLIGAAARIRPAGLSDLEVKSLMKKFKDKKFAAGCDREIISHGAAMLGMEVQELTQLCIQGMKTEMEQLGLGPKEN